MSVSGARGGTGDYGVITRHRRSYPTRLTACRGSGLSPEVVGAHGAGGPMAAGACRAGSINFYTAGDYGVITVTAGLIKPS
uniref:hypothetical protein n=1 Tax=Streptomyces longwoodensis TaxID=68231 RepID=UPI002F918A72